MSVVVLYYDAHILTEMFILHLFIFYFLYLFIGRVLGNGINVPKVISPLVLR